MSLVHGTTSNSVLIDTTGVAAGDYILNLESIDTNGSVYSTLKEDKVTIRVAFVSSDPIQDPFSNLEVMPLVAN